jgi:glucose/arabinose dehydrogenase
VLGFRRGWRPLPLPLLTLVVLALAGCGGGDDGETTASAPPPSRNTNQEGPAQARPSTGDGRGGARLQKVGDFDQPVYVTQPPGERRDLYVVEKTGRVQVVRDGQRVSKPFLDLSGQVSAGSEQGLLSLAFAPDYGKTGLLYVDYTDIAGDTRVVEYRRSSSDPLTADAGSAREVLRVDQPYENHNGGLVLFGPGDALKEGRARDDLLYIGLGDGGSADDPQRNGQDLSTLLGKILRIDPRRSGGRPYSIPRSNPFAGRSDARPEIYSYGLRNPWRFSFDRQTSDLWIGDVGQNSFEEVDGVAHGEGSGANFGWSAFEGSERFNEDQQAPDHVPPLLTYPLGGNCAVTGGYVVRDEGLRSVYGRYLYGDFCAGELRSFTARLGRRATDDRALGLQVPSLSSFGEDNAGHLYATSLEGPVYRLAPTAP